jgi:hypothetical protein
MAVEAPYGTGAHGTAIDRHGTNPPNLLDPNDGGSIDDQAAIHALCTS